MRKDMKRKTTKTKMVSIFVVLMITVAFVSEPAYPQAFWHGVDIADSGMSYEVSYSKIRTCLISTTYVNSLNRCQNLIL